MKKVVKFGGSSLADAEQFMKAGNIVRADRDRRYVVPSAPGKRVSGDTKVTDLLYECEALAEAGKDFSGVLREVSGRYEDIIRGLSLELSLQKEFQEIERRLKEGEGRDYAASRGEYLNGIIMAHYLSCAFVDAAEVIFFGENGEFDAERTNEILGERLSQEERAVIPGFYGSLPDLSLIHI